MLVIAKKKAPEPPPPPKKVSRSKATKPPRVWTIDFETEEIKSRPFYPPKPVGVAILKPGAKKAVYLAWAHPTKNNSTFEQVKLALQEVWDSGEGVLCHNGKFDLDVVETFFGLPRLPWQRIHDTMFFLFLDNPYAPDLKLKGAAERLLGIAPEERDEVEECIKKNVPEMQRNYPWPKVTKWGRKFKRPKWGAYICRAPGDLVGKYAIGDVVRTKALFDFLWARISTEMRDAYDRETRLLPILLDSERRGIRFDLKRAKRVHKALTKGMEIADAWIADFLKVPGLQVSSDKKLAEALEAADAVLQWELTDTGQKSVAKDALPPTSFRDQRLAQALGYRNRADTCRAVLETWIDMGEASGGRIFTNWNQVKSSGAFGDKGAGTGRLSSNPNFQNIAKQWEEPGDKNPDRYIHPAFLKVEKLPLMRSFLLPEEGHLWLKRDYSQQEYRIVAHFEEGLLCQAYIDQPKTDMHTFVMGQIEKVTGKKLSRKTVKTLNFGMLYGMGLAKLAKKLGVSIEEARSIKNAWKAALPDVDRMDRQIKNIGKGGGVIKTWGGRIYPVKPPTMADNGGWRTYEYKMLNDLVQGSAADCTKEAVIRFVEQGGPSVFMLTVHDEINISCAPEHAEAEMRRLRDCMASVGKPVDGSTPPDIEERFGVPMLSDGEMSKKNWADLDAWEP